MAIIKKKNRTFIIAIQIILLLLVSIFLGSLIFESDIELFSIKLEDEKSDENIQVNVTTDNSSQIEEKEPEKEVKNTPPEAYAYYTLVPYFYSNKTAPVVVYFSGEGKDSDGEIVSYHWEFGPTYLPSLPYWRYYLYRSDTEYYWYNYFWGSHSTDEQNPVRLYTRSGIYWAELTVTDNEGATDTARIDIFIWGYMTMARTKIREMFYPK